MDGQIISCYSAQVQWNLQKLKQHQSRVIFWLFSGYNEAFVRSSKIFISVEIIMPIRVITACNKLYIVGYKNLRASQTCTNMKKISKQVRFRLSNFHSHTFEQISTQHPHTHSHCTSLMIAEMTICQHLEYSILSHDECSLFHARLTNTVAFSVCLDYTWAEY